MVHQFYNVYRGLFENKGNCIRGIFFGNRLVQIIGECKTAASIRQRLFNEQINDFPCRRLSQLCEFSQAIQTGPVFLKELAQVIG